MTLVMFDVDGTLTHSNELDTRCFVQAMGEVFGFVGIDDDWSHYPHTSDAGIIAALFQNRLQRSPTPDELRRYKSHFLGLLAAQLQLTPMREITGAGRLLALLGRQPGIALALASGAWRESARAKMLSAGLPFDEFPGGFSEDAAARTEIMLASRRRAVERHGGNPFHKWVYLGDAVWDARACHQLGVPLIGLASGERAQQLMNAGAGEVLADYAEPEAVLAAIARVGLVPSPG